MIAPREFLRRALVNRASRLSGTAVATAVAAVALAVQLGVTARSVLVTRAVPVAPVAVTTVTAVSDPRAAIAALFGAVMRAAAPQELETALVLAGTVALADPGAGLALIGTTAPLARVYRAGTAVPGGGTLIEVYADHVVLEREGVRRLLQMPKSAFGAEWLAASSGGAAARKAAAEAALVAAMSENEKRNYVATRPAAVKQRDPLGEWMQVDPKEGDDDRFQGWRVSRGRDLGLLQRSGLRPDDVITSINGRPLTESPNEVDRFANLARHPERGVTLIVLRDGTPTQVVIPAGGNR